MNRLKIIFICMLSAAMMTGSMPSIFLSFAAMPETRHMLAVQKATPSDATPSDAALPDTILETKENSIGDIWDDWSGKTSFEFLSGNQGNGSEEKPYKIKNREQLMGLSELTAMGMVVQAGTGSYVGDYSEAHFALAADIDLQGINWIPIGFYQDSSEGNGTVTNAFEGHFDGNGYTIKNLKLNTFPGYDNVGLFGKTVNAELKNLTIVPDSSYYITGRSKVGILAGTVENGKIQNISINSGSVSAAGVAGGLAGEIINTTIENAVCNNVKVDAQSSTDTIYIGGIAGQASSSMIIDCSVTTGNNISACIKGRGYVGGITGSQNGTDIFNTYVSGTIGGNGSTAIGGITGEYVAGKLKAARFEGTIANSYLGAQAREGSFIGTRKGAATNFNYIDDVAYLFADRSDKIAADICGSGISDDNDYTYEAKIGFSHPGDNYYTLVQGGNTKVNDKQYYYEVLEEGILSIIDKESLGETAIDHYAPNAAGRPVRGYLVNVEQIDTIANNQHFYDVAGITLQGSSQYCKPIDKMHRGAIAYGDSIYLTTSPNNTNTEKYEMDGVPFYKNADGTKKGMTWEKVSSSFTFKMPDEDITVGAAYKKVAVAIKVEPHTYNFTVTQHRTGNRKNPIKTTMVKNAEGQLIATYINGNLQQGTQVQPVTIKAVIDGNNDVSDNKVKWSIDDSDLMMLSKNADEESDGYTNQSASLTLNTDAQFFSDITSKLEREQAEAHYNVRIPNTIFGAGHQNGGVTVLTAQTRPAASFEGKPCTANSRINVTYQILDSTYLALETMSLDKQGMEFVVTRTLEGDRKAPKESITATVPQTLSALLSPDKFSRQDTIWTVSDYALLEITQDSSAYKDALVNVRQDAKWIKDIIAIDNAKKMNDANVVLSGTGQRNAIVTMTADDKLGNRRSAECDVNIKFITLDKTYIYRPSGGSSSGGGGGSSGGGGGSSAVTPEGTTKGSAAPAGAITGTWVQNATGQWLFTGNGRTFADEWAYIHNPYAKGKETANWFRFHADGYMLTGWFTDMDGSIYYLHDVPDGTQGHMYTGWNWIDGQNGDKTCYYFSGGEGMKGRLVKSTITPDGSWVNEHGAWVMHGFFKKMIVLIERKVVEH